MTSKDLDILRVAVKIARNNTKAFSRERNDVYEAFAVLDKLHDEVSKRGIGEQPRGNERDGFFA